MSSRGEDRWSRWHVVIPRAAFTLVELLVVIAIIGSLIALLIPAVQSARESARRVTCSNRAKQIALAAHAYENAMERFPSGNSTEMIGLPTISGASAKYVPKDPRNWLVFLLPHLENQSLYDKIIAIMPITSGTTFPSSSVPDVNRPISDVQCPSDANASKIYGTIPAVRGFFSNFRGVAASTVLNPNGLIDGAAGTVDLEGAEPAATGSTDGGTRLNGILYPRSKVRIANVTDGLSKTLLITEGIAVPANSTFTDNRGSVWSFNSMGTILATTKEPPNTPVGDRLRYCMEYPKAPCEGLTTSGATSPGPMTNIQLFARSYHSGVNAALADGSVSFFVDSVDAGVWRALGTRAGID